MIRTIWAMVIAVSALTPATAQSGNDAAWANLRALTGEWEGVYGTTKSTVTYAVVSGGNTVMESMKMPAPQPDMVTMYHRDGAAFVATHYCSMGNQPRMRAAEASADGKTIRFRFADITNLAKPDGAHIRHLTITFQDADHLTQEWTAFDGKAEHTEVFKWTRKKP